jgi:hypothetical protein
MVLAGQAGPLAARQRRDLAVGGLAREAEGAEDAAQVAVPAPSAAAWISWRGPLVEASTWCCAKYAMSTLAPMVHVPFIGASSPSSRRSGVVFPRRWGRRGHLLAPFDREVDV